MSDANSSAPHAPQRYTPVSLLCSSSPLNAGSVPAWRSTRYRSGPSSCFHSASVLLIFASIVPPSGTVHNTPGARGVAASRLTRRRRPGPRARRTGVDLRAHSSGGERYIDTVEVRGSKPRAPTSIRERPVSTGRSFCSTDRVTRPRRVPRTPRPSARSRPLAWFSSKWAIDDVPGIGSITGERCSSQASAIWDGVASWAAATRSSRPPGLARSPVASGNHGMKPMPARSHASSTSSCSRSARL